MLQRRSFITGLVALVAAPAIVRVASLMPVNAALQPINQFLSIDYAMRISMRRITQYVPGEGEIDRLDVLFDQVRLPRYSALYA